MITEPQPVTEQLVENTPLGRYVVRSWIRDGSMATVYRGEHVDTHAPVAIKVMTHAASHDPTARARFSRESVLLGRLAGVAHVAMVHDVGELPDGRRYIVMEWVDGEDLSDVLARLRHHGRRMAPLRACRIARDVARALVVAHTRGIVHRDIKPANIMLDGSGPHEVAKILDFGISADLEPQVVAQNLTRGAIVGTEVYMSPEQSLGDRPTPAMDVWGLGVVFLEMLRGAKPNIDLRHGVFPPFPQPAPFPPDTLPLVQSCLALDPAQRPPTAEVVDRLERLVTTLEHDAIETRTFEATVPAVAATPAPAPSADPVDAPPPRPGGLAIAGMIECPREPQNLGPSPMQLESPHPPRRWEYPLDDGVVERMPGRDMTVPTPAASMPAPGVAPRVPTVPPMTFADPMRTMPPAPSRLSATMGPWSASTWNATPPRPTHVAAEPEPPAPSRNSGARWALLSLGFVGVGLGLAGAFVWAEQSLRESNDPVVAAVARGPETPPAAEPMAEDAAEGPSEPPSAADVVGVVPAAAPPPEAAQEPEKPVRVAAVDPPRTASKSATDAKTDAKTDADSKTSKPARPRPTSKTPPTSREQPDCADVIQAAEAARRERAWTKLLSATQHARCWSSSTERMLLRVTAMLELGRFESCVKEAGDSTDERLQVRVKICRQRLEGRG